MATPQLTLGDIFALIGSSRESFQFSGMPGDVSQCVTSMIMFRPDTLLPTFCVSFPGLKVII